MPNHISFLENQQFECFTDSALFEAELDPNMDPPNGFPIFGSIRDCQRCFNCCCNLCLVVKLTLRKVEIFKDTTAKDLLPEEDNFSQDSVEGHSGENVAVKSNSTSIASLDLAVGSKIWISLPENARYKSVGKVPGFRKIGFPLAFSKQGSENDFCCEIIALEHISLENLLDICSNYAGCKVKEQEIQEIGGIKVSMPHHNDHYWTPTNVIGSYRIAFDFEEFPAKMAQFKAIDVMRDVLQLKAGDFQMTGRYYNLIVPSPGLDPAILRQKFALFEKDIHSFSPGFVCKVLYEALVKYKDLFESLLSKLTANELEACFVAEYAEWNGNTLLCVELGKRYNFYEKLKVESGTMSLGNWTVELICHEKTNGYEVDEYTKGKWAYKIFSTESSIVYYFVPETLMIQATFKGGKFLMANGGSLYEQHFVFKEDPDSEFIIWGIKYDSCQYFIKTFAQNFEFLLNLLGVLTSGRIEFFEQKKQLVFHGIFNVFIPIRGYLIDLVDGSRIEMGKILRFDPHQSIFEYLVDGREKTLKVYQEKVNLPQTKLASQSKRWCCL